MKKEKLNESVNKIKYLFEYHFKGSGSERSASEENPVKFSEIGDKYTDSDNDYPTYDEYRNEVMIDEDDPEQPTPEEKPAPPQAPAPQPEPQQPPAAPVQPAPVPEPAPQPAIPQEPVNTGGNDLETKLQDQISKTEQMMNMISNIQAGIGTLQLTNNRVEQVAKEVEDIKNPSYDKQFDMISKNSYPYNIKLSDYWGWNDAKQAEKEQEYTINQDDVNNYDPNLIKKSLNLSEQIHISDLK